MDVEHARQQMVGQQVRTWEVLDGRVLDVLASVPRERFVPDRFRGLAFAEIQVPLGHGESMMAPMVEGRMLQALALRATDRVLEVGTGSGFVTACLARLAGEVRSLEIHPELAELARARLAQQAVANAQVEVRDGSSLDPVLPRYDAICVTGSLPTLEPSHQEHLAIGGRLFVVIGEAQPMQALLITRVAEKAYRTESLFETLLAPLRNARRPTRSLS
jgi:protein-L-isoaspartate(D-aspartate) O-methyltransferase